MPKSFKRSGFRLSSEKTQKPRSLSMSSGLPLCVLAFLSASLSAQTNNPAPPVQQLPNKVPLKLPMPIWQFPDIHVTATGSSTVKVEWMPLSGANQYIVYRNDAQIGPVHPADPAVVQTMNAVDVSAPAASHLTYKVIAYHLGTILSISGQSATGELPLGTSHEVPVDTPAGTPPAAPLSGFVDLHTHPMANLGFGGKLLYGGVDVGSLLPADPDCKKDVRAASEQQALGHDKSTHGDAFASLCGDTIRAAVIHGLQTGLHGADESEDATGYPDFKEWPVWNDLTHQKMWVEWIRRAHQGGLNVMVALAVNNKTLGDLVSGPTDYPTDDKTSADLQIMEIQSFVGRHLDFMEVAYTASELQRIVASGKLAVVVGIEVDHIGNFQTASNPGIPSDADVKIEIDRLYNEGVRYIFPIHVLDNAFGGTAAYVNLFNVSNVREDGRPYDLVCSDPQDNITYIYNNDDLNVTGIAVQLVKKGWAVTAISSPTCTKGIGQKNQLTLLSPGTTAIKEMMRLGMLIDIDHMSQAATDKAIFLAQSFGYPLNSGHNGIRGSFGADSQTERSLRVDQYASIGKLHGMAGVGSSGTFVDDWIRSYTAVVQAMGTGVAAGFGTDTNGFALGMPPPLNKAPPVVPGPQYQQYQSCVSQCKCPQDNARTVSCLKSCGDSCRTKFPNAFLPPAPPTSGVVYSASFLPSVDNGHTWDYNFYGVAHYGMLPDFLKDVSIHANGQATIDNLMRGAEYFYQTWVIAEAKKSTISP